MLLTSCRFSKYYLYSCLSESSQIFKLVKRFKFKSHCFYLLRIL